MDVAEREGFVPVFRRLLAEHHRCQVDHVVQEPLRMGDLYVFDVVGRRVLCRVRESGYADRFPTQFTFRSRRPTGDQGIAELARVLGGFGEQYLYAHAAEFGAELTRWMLIDLGVFRAHYGKPAVMSGEIINRDRGSATRWFEARSLPSDLIVARWPDGEDDGMEAVGDPGPRVAGAARGRSA